MTERVGSCKRVSPMGCCLWASVWQIMQCNVAMSQTSRERSEEGVFVYEGAKRNKTW